MAAVLDDNTLRIVARLRRPRERVFDAWADRDAVHPVDVPARRHVDEVRARRHGRAARGAIARPQSVRGRTFATSGKYLEVKRPERLVFTWAHHETDDFAAPRGHETTVHLEFRSLGNKTELTLIHGLVRRSAELAGATTTAGPARSTSSRASCGGQHDQPSHRFAVGMAEGGRAHLAKEKEFTRLREELAQRAPRAAVGEGREGATSSRRPKAGSRSPTCSPARASSSSSISCSGPDWNEGCPSCSFWTDNFNGIDVHLAHRDTAFVLVSRAPIDKLEAYRKRMGWTVRWVSSLGNDFNFDYGVSFPPDEKGAEVQFRHDEALWPGGARPQRLPQGDDGAIYRTYSTYARGLDVLNGTYHLLDMTSKGRDEDPKHPMSWVRRHDRY